MRFGRFYSHDLKCMMVQVNIAKARRLYNEGKTVYMHGCMMRFDNMWQKPCPMEKEREAWQGETFDTRVNAYTYYNCDNERGKYPCFFVKEVDA